MYNNDVKPNNILVKNEKLKLVDFGNGMMQNFVDLHRSQKLTCFSEFIQNGMFSGAYCLLEFGTEQFFKFYEYADSDSLKLSLYYSATQQLPQHI